MSTTPDYGEPWGYDIDYDMALTKNGSVCDANRAVACVNACACMADPAAEIQAMREAIREAHRFIRDIVKNHECGDDTDASGEAALTKLQTFIKP